MFLNRLTANVLQRYLLRLPQRQRLVRYYKLMDIAWFKPSLQAIRTTIFPEEKTVAASSKQRPERIQPLSPHYLQYRCVQSNPLGCQAYLGNAVDGDANLTCEQCYFPGIFAVEQILTGTQGQYQIGRWIGQRGISRLYEGILIGSEEPVIIQEFLLPDRYFNADEQRRYQKQFIGVAGLTLADGRSQDIRVIAPLDAIADPAGDRSFLITPMLNQMPTLNCYCAQHGPFSQPMVRDLLNQVLQTLVFLHQQTFTLPSGQTQRGIIHGNLSLNSLLWRPNKSPSPPQGFVYLTDFDQWANVLDPATLERGEWGDPEDEQGIQDDLGALGQIAFWLLNGATVDAKQHPLNPRVDSDWLYATDKTLKQFIWRLIGIEAPFASAEAARNALLQIPSAPVVSRWERRKDDILSTQARPRRRPGLRMLLPLVAIALLLAVFGSVVWVLWRSRRVLHAQPLLPPCCMEEVGVVPKGSYIYAIPAPAYWHSLFQASALSGEAIAHSPGLLNQVQALQPDELVFTSLPTASIEDAIAAVQTEQAAFALLPLIQPLPPEMTSTVIAYDSLVPVVAFSYFERENGLPNALHGQISLSQLQDLYTNKIANWKALTAVDLPVQPYWSNAPTTQDFFVQQVLNTSSVSAPPRSTTSVTNQTTLDIDSSFITSNIVSLPTLPMFRQILEDFENKNIGSIGIAPLSQVFGQCSVYPLALSTQARSVSPLIFTNGRDITPASDLCDRKGSYIPNHNAIRDGTYPLAYPLAIVYPFDNTRSDIGAILAQLFLTLESQRDLAESGMVPVFQPK